MEVNLTLDKVVIVIYEVENNYQGINMHTKNLVNIIMVNKNKTELYNFYFHGTEKYRTFISSCLIYHSAELQIY